MDWTHGYYAETGYNYGFYVETMPARLRWAAMVHGHTLPETNFRYLDAGCGQGLNLVLAAALHPDSEFVGIDFMPEHVAHVRRLASQCGLTNVTCIEADFADLAADPSALGEFDMTICHGIATWIDPQVKQALFSLVGQTLRPGGVFYNSYNTYPGWLSAVPFQHLALLEQRQKNGIKAVTAARETLNELEKISEKLSKNLPGLPSRLKSTETQNPAYLVQEYLNQAWRPVFVSEMIDDMRRVKMDYLGTTMLADSFVQLMPTELRELIEKQETTTLREQMRDYAVMQTFRRDLYVKGMPALWAGERAEAMRSLAVITNPLTQRPPAGEPYKLSSSISELLGDADYYHGLLKQIDARPDGITVGELIDAEPERARQLTLIQTLSLLIHGGWITPRITAPNLQGAQISAALAKLGSNGAPYREFPMPVTGTAIRLTAPDMLLVNLDAEGVSEDQLLPRMLAGLTKLGQQLAKDGKAITDEAERTAFAQTLVNEFVEKKRPYFERVGMLSPAK